MIIGGFKTKYLTENLIMYGVEFLEHTIGEYERFSRIQEYSLDNLSIDSESPFARESMMFKEGSEYFTRMKRFGRSLFCIWCGVSGVCKMNAEVLSSFCFRH